MPSNREKPSIEGGPLIFAVTSLMMGALLLCIGGIIGIPMIVVGVAMFAAGGERHDYVGSTEEEQQEADATTIPRAS